MFLSRVANRVIYEQLMASPELRAVVGERIYRGYRYPEGAALPACLFYMEQSAWDGAVHTIPAEHLSNAEMRFVVRVDGVGDSDDEIAPAAQAQLDALAGQEFRTDDGFQVTFTARGEVPMTSTYEGAQQYQRLGTIYTVYVTRGV